MIQFEIQGPPGETTHYVNVLVNGKCVCQVGVLTEGLRPIVSIRDDSADLTDELLRDIKENLHLVDNVFSLEIIQREEDMLPRYERQRRSGPDLPPITNGRFVPEDRGDLLDDDDVRRRAIITRIMDSMILDENQTAKQASSVTRELAETFGMKKMAIAGIRAAFTRGVYGDPRQMIERRKIELVQRKSAQRDNTRFS